MASWFMEKLESYLICDTLHKIVFNLVSHFNCVLLLAGLVVIIITAIIMSAVDVLKLDFPCDCEEETWLK